MAPNLTENQHVAKGFFQPLPFKADPGEIKSADLWKHQHGMGILKGCGAPPMTNEFFIKFVICIR